MIKLHYNIRLKNGKTLRKQLILEELVNEDIISFTQENDSQYRLKLRRDNRTYFINDMKSMLKIKEVFEGGPKIGTRHTSLPK